mgnify:CR=1 FL=1
MQMRKFLGLLFLLNVQSHTCPRTLLLEETNPLSVRCQTQQHTLKTLALESLETGLKLTPQPISTSLQAEM